MVLAQVASNLICPVGRPVIDNDQPPFAVESLPGKRKDPLDAVGEHMRLIQHRDDDIYGEIRAPGQASVVHRQAVKALVIPTETRLKTRVWKRCHPKEAGDFQSFGSTWSRYSAALRATTFWTGWLTA